MITYATWIGSQLRLTNDKVLYAYRIEWLFADLKIQRPLTDFEAHGTFTSRKNVEQTQPV